MRTLLPIVALLLLPSLASATSPARPRCFVESALERVTLEYPDGSIEELAHEIDGFERLHRLPDAQEMSCLRVYTHTECGLNGTLRVQNDCESAFALTCDATAFDIPTGDATIYIDHELFPTDGNAEIVCSLIQDEAPVWDATFAYRVWDVPRPEPGETTVESALCASTGPSAPTSAPTWALLGLLILGWRRRR